MSLFEGIFSKLFENKYISPRNIFSDLKTLARFLSYVILAVGIFLIAEGLMKYFLG